MTLGLVALLALGALPAPPNAILLTLDTTRADHLGSYGHAGARRPALDRLAERRPVAAAGPSGCFAWELEEAVRAFELARSQGPENREVVDLHLGMACVQAGRADEAVAALERVVQINARNATALRTLGDIAYSRQQVDVAQGYYRRFLEAAPADPAAGELRARVGTWAAGRR